LRRNERTSNGRDVPGYEPIDLSSAANAPTRGVGDDDAAGHRTFRGLPFIVGDRAIVLGPGDSPVTVPVGRTATHVIVAHRMLETDVLEGGDIGATVAEYVFHSAAGRRTAVPIRERFETGMLPTWWGGLPFRAFPDGDNTMYRRWDGRWDNAGSRQTEADQAWPTNWYLWAWVNPSPDTSLERVEIVPKDRRCIIGAITTSDLDEFPFNRQARRPVVIELADPSAEPIEVRVDRGWANYVHPLPEKGAGDFLADPLKGFGERRNASWSPAYVEIGALDSATVTVRRGEDDVASVNWAELQRSGAIDTPRARFEIRDPGRNWVRVTVVDDATGEPVPCKVHFRSPDGIPYQPHGHHQQVNSNNGTWHIDVGGDVRLGQITYAYIDGTCEGWLPRGECIVDVSRGYEYQPVRETVTIEPGQRELTVRLRRRIDMNARGWYSGDTHVHFLSQQGAHVESQGEDLNVVNLLQSQWGALFTNTEEFTGAASVARGGSNIVYVTQENRQHILGHLTLLGLKRPVMPWCTDGPSEAEMGSALEATMSDWADRCHEQCGWVVIPHLPNPNGEPATLIATDRADAVEMLVHGEYNHIEYYRYLNGGYRLPLVGGTDKMTSDVPVGMYRAYVKLDDAFTYENWCKAMAAGRTFLSGGPMIHLSVDGREVGDTVQLSGRGTVDVEAWAESIFPIHTLQIVQRGRVVASADDANGTRRLELREKLRIDEHTWLAARCGGPNFTAVPHRDGWSRGIFAHTSPVYVACGDDWSMFDEGTSRYMLNLIDGCLSYIDDGAPYWEPGNITHHHGEADHQAWLRRPFLDARNAVEKRLAQHGLL
jgi:hypothetical protein